MSEIDLPHYSKFAPSGLGNPGNLCYLNALIQTFASSKQWINFFDIVSDVHPSLKQFSLLLHELNLPFAKDQTVSTKPLRKELNAIGLGTNISTQQDANEFYTHLLDTLLKVMPQVSTSPFTAFSTLRVFPTQCIYEETITCSICRAQQTSVNPTSFFIIDADSESIDVGLHQFFGPVGLRSHCDRCNRTTDKYLTRRILFAPKVLLFFINRRQDYYGASPMTTPFQFRSSIDFRPYCLVPPEQAKPDDGALKLSLSGISETIQEASDGYYLTAAVVFKGKDNAGHYMSYRLHREEIPPYTKQWVLANDNHTTQVTLDTVMQSNRQCLMLQYEMSF